MKKTIMLILLAFISARAMAIDLDQYDVTFTEEKKFCLVIDWSYMKIDGKEVEDWLDYRQLEQPQYDAVYELESEIKPTVKGKLLFSISDKIKTKGAYFVSEERANYKITVIVGKVERKGSNKVKIVISDKSGNELGAFGVRGYGGSVGSMANLWGDGFKSTGQAIGKELLKMMK